MEQKRVNIIGLEAEGGIIKAHKVEFDKNNRLVVIKGIVGSGKTTEQNLLKAGTLGTKTLTDNELYGDIKTLVLLEDGENSIYVDCKSAKDGKLNTTIYKKDAKGKKEENPVIDGKKITPAAYLGALQTELTWKMDELTSENLSVQKNILLKLYQHKLIKEGVLFDKKDPAYKESILGQIDKALENRDFADMVRKQKGGIADDLKAKGVDPNKPDTIPDFTDLKEIDDKIIKQKTKISTVEEAAKNEKKDSLNGIKTKLQDLNLKAGQFNAEQKEKFNKAVKKWSKNSDKINEIDSILLNMSDGLTRLSDIESLSEENHKKIAKKVRKYVSIPKEEDEPKAPKYIETNKNGKITDIDVSLPYVEDFLNLKAKYIEIDEKEIDIEESIEKYQAKIVQLENEKKLIEISNKTVEAVDSFHNWSDANEEVKALQTEYSRKLANVDTGVEGLVIVVDKKDNVYLTYNGHYDPKYFKNTKKEPRKLSSYSGTQRPMIAMLVQYYLLSLKAKAMRYLYIDDIPIDKATRALIEKMGEELDITIILNMTGDFDKHKLKNGEMLIENGEVFWK